MTEQQRTLHNLEVTADGRTVATAQVSTSPDPHGTARASFLAASGHIPPQSRRDLVDAVLDLPEVRGNAQLEATVPLGDTESMDRLRQRTCHMSTRAAGASALVDAVLPQPPPAVSAGTTA